MKILFNVETVFGEVYEAVFVYDCVLPDWCWDKNCDGEILSWGGFENAIGWK
jgi:hypothetical protein